VSRGARSQVGSIEEEEQRSESTHMVHGAAAALSSHERNLEVAQSSEVDLLPGVLQGRCSSARGAGSGRERDGRTWFRPMMTLGELRYRYRMRRSGSVLRKSLRKGRQRGNKGSRKRSGGRASLQTPS